MNQLPDYDVWATSMTNAADEMRKMQNLPVVDIGRQLLQMQQQIQEQMRQMDERIQEQMRQMEERLGERLDRIFGQLSRSYVDLCHFFRGLN